MLTSGFSRCRTALPMLLAMVIAGCGGSNDSNGGGGDQGGGDSAGRGTLLDGSPTLVQAMSADNFLSGIGTALREALLLQAGEPVCDVAVYKIQYRTVGARGEDTD